MKKGIFGRYSTYLGGHWRFKRNVRKVLNKLQGKMIVVEGEEAAVAHSASTLY